MSVRGVEGMEQRRHPVERATVGEIEHRDAVSACQRNGLPRATCIARSLRFRLSALCTPVNHPNGQPK